MKTNSNEDRRINASALSRLQHEILAIDALKLPPQVPKKVGDKAVQSLMRAISRMGQQIVPILVDDENVIIAGFEVAAAMGELGANEVAVVKLSNLTQAETKAIMLLLAKIPERSDWDGEAVSTILQEISIEDPDALDITGLEIGEIDVALGKSRETDSDRPNGDNTEDSDQNFCRFPPGYIPVVRQGDVFNLGQHRIACGNSLEAETYRLLMAGEQAAALIADPPYNIKIADNV